MIPHITIEQAKAIYPLDLPGGCEEWLTLLNTRIDKVNAQPELPDPHATLRAKYAKHVAEGTTRFYLLEVLEGATWKRRSAVNIFYPNLQYRCTDISCYVSKDGEPAIRMLRTEAQELQRQTKDTHDWSHYANTPAGDYVFTFDAGGTYNYRTKQPKLKQLDWSRVPVGVMTNKGELRCIYRNTCNTLIADIEFKQSHGFGTDSDTFELDELRLAPASEQRWIAVQDDDGTLYEGLNYAKQYNNMLCTIAYRITSLAEGYTYGGDV